MVKKILSKFLTFWIYIKYPKIPSQQRWFIRFRYFGRLQQLKYFFKDYIIKKPYKVITFSGEFQQEILHVLPFAYWHFKNGTLLRTESSAYTKDLYFFSPKHIEHENLLRDYIDNENIEIPNAPHDTKLLKHKWSNVPLKKQFQNNIIKFEKDILVIANRYNSEWGKNPISYFSLEKLGMLFQEFKERFQIIYNRPPANKIAGDNSEVKELKDEAFIRKNYPSVIILSDIEKNFKLKVNSYNHLQLMVYANSTRFISIHGGTATLASAFGGRNLIYSKVGHEHALNEFTNVFPEIANTEILIVRDENELLSAAKKFIR